MLSALPPAMPFPHEYAGTQHFATHAAALGTLREHPLAQRGPLGEALASHSLWQGPKEAAQVLVVLSGTHGVEGLAGSAIQQDLVRRLAAQHLTLPPDCALLLVHLLNPWGCAWLRRCDAEGIDLNRNFIDFNAPRPLNPGYAQLRDLLLGEDAAARHSALAAYADAHGRAALEIAVSGGQYQDPAGPFFGGTGPAHGRQLVETLIHDHALAGRQLAVIDLHTGLGPYGYGEIICDHDPDSDGTRTAQRWYGDAVTLPLAGTSSSVPKTGLLDYAWHAIMDARSCFVTLEFGTFSTDALFDVLLQDHRLHQQGMPDWHADTTRAVKHAMRAHFCPDAAQWQQLVLFRARQVIDLALTGMHRDRHRDKEQS